MNLISGSERRADFWSNILAATAPSERANKVMEALGYKTFSDSQQQHSLLFYYQLVYSIVNF